MGKNMRERGQSTVWLLAVLVLAVTIAWSLTRLAVDADRRSSAQSTADLVALAGVTGGHDASVAVSQRNGAVIVDWSINDGRVSATIRRGDVTASSAAAPDRGEPDNTVPDNTVPDSAAAG